MVFNTEGVFVMKFIAKILSVVAVAVTAITVSAAPSEAAKKKKGMAPGTYQGQLCTTPSVTANVGAVLVWGYDNKWYQAGWGCVQPWCPVACT
jgi:hypothetical protein